MVNSNVVTVTEAALAITISLVVSSTTEPVSGGQVTLTATTDIPDGSIIYFFQGPSGSLLGSSATVGGQATLSVTIPPNSTTNIISYSFQASTNSNNT